MNNKTLFNFFLLLVAYESYVICSDQSSLPLFSNEQLTEMQALMNENSSPRTAHSEFNKSPSLVDQSELNEDLFSIIQPEFDESSYLYTQPEQQNEHSQKKLYPCTKCNKLFSFESQLTVHMRIHSSEKPFSCTKCDKSFTRRDSLTIHMRTHTSEKPFACVQCNKLFAHKDSLIYHLKLHTKKDLQTMQTEDYLTTENPLNYNNSEMISTHLYSNPLVCLICNKLSRCQSALVIHMRTHTGEKPYKCTLCNKLFTQKNNLNIHMRKHTKEHAPQNPCFQDQTTITNTKKSKIDTITLNKHQFSTIVDCNTISEEDLRTIEAIDVTSTESLLASIDATKSLLQIQKERSMHE